MSVCNFVTISEWQIHLFTGACLLVNIVYYLAHFNRYLCQGTVFERVCIEEVEGEPSSGYGEGDLGLRFISL